MNLRTFTTFCLIVACSLISYSLQAQATPFYLETFPTEASFTDNWTQGGTNNGPEDWVWSDNPTAIFNGQPDFASTTADNGFIQFNSDSNGDNPHDVFVTSPAIDCSGQNTVFLRFENQYGFFSAPTVSIAEVGVSTNGTDFTFQQILTDVARNNLSDDVQVVLLELPEAANQSTVYLRFRWRGNFEYSWRIDDIGLYDENPLPANDLTLEFPRVPFNFATPLSQVEADSFGLVIQNVGAAAQNNVMAQVDVQGDNGDSFNATEMVGAVDPQNGVSITFDNTFTAANTGNYTYTYTITQDETDAFPQDNTFSGEFVITQSVFSKDDGIIVSATAPDMVVEDFWEVGNYYTVSNDGFEVYELDFMVAGENNAHQGQTVTVFLYRIEDDGNSTFDDGDLVAIGFNTFTFTDEENFTPITVELKDLLTQEVGVAVTPGEYLATIQLPDDIFIAYSTLPYYYDLATLVKNGQWFTGGFGADQTAFMRMRIREVSTSTEEPQLTDEQVNLYPNPVDLDLTVQIDLQNASDNTQVQVMDAAGKMIWLRNFDNVKAQTLRIDASQWATGTYFLHVRTDEGVKTKRFVVQR